MIQDIGEHKFDLSFRQPEARDEDYVLYMKSNKTLLRKTEDGNYEIPRFADFPMEKVRLKMKAYYLFAIDGTGYYYVREMLQGEEEGYEFCPTSVFRKMTPMYQAFAGITATQLHRWKESRRFCGCCGHETEDSKTERGWSSLLRPDGIPQDLPGRDCGHYRRRQDHPVQIPGQQ